MAGYRQSFSSSSSSCSSGDGKGISDSLLHDRNYSSTSTSTSSSSSSSSFEKRMAHHASTASHWGRVALANLPTSRRPTRLLVAIISTCLFFTLFRSNFLSGWSSDPSSSSTNFAQRGHHIPPKIWQVMFTPPNTDPETGVARYNFAPDQIPYSNSWLAHNPDYDYTLVTTQDANEFVRKHFARDADILDVHFGLRNHGPRSDLMRYLLMYVEGGVYSDTDVTCLRPIDTWIPAEWRKDVKAVVGIEGDSLGGPVIEGMLWDVQFGQWTVAAAPRHRLFRKMIESVIQRLGDLCKLKDTTIDKLAMTDMEIMNSTATALWSETIFNELKISTANTDEPLKKFSDLSGMTEPRLYGDILVLPIDYIGSGVPHSNASPEAPEFALVKHHFSGSWRDTDGIQDEGDD
ncbi:unnamed protein product [Discula destructiva]